MSFCVGDKVWSAMFGDGTVADIADSPCTYPVHAEFGKRGIACHTRDGRYIYNQLPTLFHAGTELIPAPEPDRELKLEKPKPFEPFQKVLVRDNCVQSWEAQFFSHYEERDNGHTYYHCMLHAYAQCLPYEGNEHLLGTADDPDAGEK
jgi:hypothetical protein